MMIRYLFWCYGIVTTIFSFFAWLLPLNMVILFLLKARGEMSEWSKEHAWKACIRATVSRVQIPFSPPEKIPKDHCPSGFFSENSTKPDIAHLEHDSVKLSCFFITIVRFIWNCFCWSSIKIVHAWRTSGARRISGAVSAVGEGQRSFYSGTQSQFCCWNNRRIRLANGGLLLWKNVGNLMIL